VIFEQLTSIVHVFN